MNAPPTRRNFLKTSAVASAVGAATLSLGRSAHAAGSDVIKIGLIGCGGRGAGAAAQAMTADKGSQLCAMADVFADHISRNRDHLKRKYGEQVNVPDDRMFAGFDGYQGVIGSDVDVVQIACASRFHPYYAKVALEAGKHVFVEKPQGIDPVGARVVTEAAELAREKGLTIVAGQHLRYEPCLQETMNRIHDGAIGDIHTMEVSFMRGPYRVSARDPNWTDMEWNLKTWYHFRWLSGDDVVQSMVHPLDCALWAVKDAAPLGAYALGGRSSMFDAKYGDVFDHAAFCYEFPGGVRCYGFNRTQHDCHGGHGTYLVGSKGRCHLYNGVIEGENAWKYDGPRIGGHQNEQNVMFASLRKGEPINDGFRMGQSTMAAILGQMAVYDGRRLTYDQVAKSSFAYPPEGEISFDTTPPVALGEDGRYPVPTPGKWRLA